jgi:hypothetical protein
VVAGAADEPDELGVRFFGPDALQTLSSRLLTERGSQSLSAARMSRHTPAIVQFEDVAPLWPDRCRTDRTSPCWQWHPKSQALNGGRDTLTEAERWAWADCVQTGWEYGL